MKDTNSDIIFSHISDIHLGAFGGLLRDYSSNAFKMAIRKSIEMNVKFIIISGDLFHTHVPSMHSAREAAELLREAKERGIKVYMVYGSHDYSPNYDSMIDILNSAGLVNKVQRLENNVLIPLIDEDLGVAFYGIDARRNGIDADLWKSIRLERAPDDLFNILIAHTAVRELLPKNLAGLIEAVSLSELPSGMSYYAIGHIHSPAFMKYQDSLVAQPGALFGSSVTDLQDTALGMKRGFFVYRKGEAEFVEISPVPIIYSEIDLDGKSPWQFKQDSVEIPPNSVLVLRLKGNLSSGSPSEVDTSSLTKRANSLNTVLLIKRDLKGPEVKETQVSGTVEEIEEEILKKTLLEQKNIFLKDIDSKQLKQIMDILSQEKKEGEKESDRIERIFDTYLKLIGVDQ